MTLPSLPPSSPSSISWRINAERIALFGWGRAILLQLAHPLVAAGVYEHSGFRGSPYSAASRLYHTVHAMLALTFGSENARERTLDTIRGIHRRVNGVLAQDTGPFPSGTRYSAEDPALVLWVHATLVESVILVFEQLVAPLSEAERDEYLREAFPVAVALAARDEDVPRTWRALQAYLDTMYASGSIVVGPQARELAEAVLSPAGLWLVAPATRINRTLTQGLLPPGVREQYRMTWTSRHERRFARLASAVRTLRKVLPDALAQWAAARRVWPESSALDGHAAR